MFWAFEKGLINFGGKLFNVKTNVFQKEKLIGSRKPKNYLKRNSQIFKEPKITNQVWRTTIDHSINAHSPLSGGHDVMKRMESESEQISINQL